jgi:hypothetical protein
LIARAALCLSLLLAAAPGAAQAPAGVAGSGAEARSGAEGDVAVAGAVDLDALDRAAREALAAANAPAFAAAITALAATDPDAAYALGRDADRDGALSFALAAFEAAVAADPGARFARHAGSRARALRQQLDLGADDAIATRRAELVALAATDVPAALEGMRALATEAASAGPAARADVLHHLGGLHDRAGDPTAAWEAYRELVALEGAPERMREVAFDRLIFLAGAAHRIRETRALVEPWLTERGHPRPLIDRALDELLDQEQQQVLDRVALVALPAFALVWLLRRGFRGLNPVSLWRSGVVPRAVFIVWIFGFAAIASEIWFHGNFEALAACIPVSLVLLVLSSSMAVADPHPPRVRRFLSAFITAVATFSALYLTLRTFERTAMLGM